MLREDINGLFRRIKITKQCEEFARKKSQQIKKFIRKEKFRTGWIELPELKLKINLGPNQLYRFEIIHDIFEREQEIYDYYQQKNVKIAHTSYSRLNGLCIPLNNLELEVKCQANIVLVKSDLKEPTKTYVIGHENGHFIFNMNLKNQLYRIYDVPPRIQDQIRDSEDFGMFCGNIAMANAGYILKEIQSVSPNPEILEREQRARGLVIELFPDQFYYSLFGKK